MDLGEYEACPEPPKPFVDIIEDGFGFVTNEEGVNEIVRRYTFTNQNNLIIQVISYGAAITSVKYPDKDGVLDDVVLGFDDMDGYLSPVNPYFGAIVGRCANRIAKGHFRIGEGDCQLSLNAGEHHLHGGFRGFDKANWKSEIQDKKVMMSYVSKDGEEGYPGEVLTFVSYEVTTDNELIIEMKATSSKATPINLTNHSYFNLGGHSKGAESLYQHVVSINADRYCHTDENFIPTGMLKNVVNTIWDLRIGRELGKVMPHVPYGGYDQNMCIHKTSSEAVTFIARVVHPKTKRTLEIYSNQPGVQFYTSNHFPSKSSITGEPDGECCINILFQILSCYRERQGYKGKARRSLLQAPGTLSGDPKLPRCCEPRKFYKYCHGYHEFVFGRLETELTTDGCRVMRCPVCGQLIRDPDFELIPDDEKPMEDGKLGGRPVEDIQKVVGKGGAVYYKHAGFCLMTQKYPDSVHRKNFPNTIIKAGETYCHIVKYKFDLFEDADGELEEDDMIHDSEVEGEFAKEETKDLDNFDDLLETKLEENGR